MTFAAAYWWPGAVHEGNGIVQLAIDERATPDQRTAILNIASGKEGCTFFEIFASVVSKVLDPCMCASSCRAIATSASPT